MPTQQHTAWSSTGDADSLLDAIITINDRTQAQRFFRDLCTERELDEMVSRWAVVRGLADGASYRSIHDTTGVSTATITRINDWVRNGTGGYGEALSRLGIEQAER
jgi:TrpR-related protein YerC/YecD